MKLSKLIDYFPPDEFYTGRDVDVSGFATHSKKVSGGDVFFAMKGEKSDGRAFIKEAVSRNASAVVVQERLKEEISAPQIVMRKPLLALSKWSSFFYGFPAEKLKITGVTGTNGKSTVAGLIKQIMELKGKSGLIGTSGYLYADKKGKFSMTTPQAHELQWLLSDMVDNGIETVVMEVSSHALELGRVEDINFESVVFTNLTQDHLDFHKTMENYFRAKLKIFSKIKTKDRGKALVNVDDGYGRRIKEKKGEITASYAVKEEADYNADIKSMTVRKSRFIFRSPKEKRKLDVKLIGRFNIYNCLAALAWAVEGGYDMSSVCGVVSGASPIPGRMEHVKKGKESGRTVIVDYAHTPDALENVLLTLRDVCRGRIVCVFGCGGERDRTKRPLMGKIAGLLADYVCLTSDNPRGEDPMGILLDIEVGLRDTATEYSVISDREEAIGHSLQIADKGDVVLIAGKGDENYQVIGDREIPFSDMATAEKYLKK